MRAPLVYPPCLFTTDEALTCFRFRSVQCVVGLRKGQTKETDAHVQIYLFVLCVTVHSSKQNDVIPTSPSQSPLFRFRPPRFEVRWNFQRGNTFSRIDLDWAPHRCNRSRSAVGTSQIRLISISLFEAAASSSN